jgi:hypothetical protein
MAAAEATALDPPPAFFTILGDITQGNQPAEFALVDRALAGLGVPYVPVPGNHDYLVAASYDGTPRALVPGTPALPHAAPTCSEAPPAGCGDTKGPPPIALGAVGIVVLRRRRRCARRWASDDSDLG